MNATSTFLPYSQTGYFSTMILDYLSQSARIQPFFEHAPTIEGVGAAMQARSQFKTNRPLLVNVLHQQYQHLAPGEAVSSNINLLLSDTTYTVCTAHQPNIFTGPLYFFYKIIHAIKLADTLKLQFPGNDFVPVYYMGSEDADLEELGHFFMGGDKYNWQTNQTGAVGRMLVDKNLVQLIEEISGQLLVHPFGEEVISMLRHCYKQGTTIEEATLQLVHLLFGDNGLVVLAPDNASLKEAYAPVIKKELLENFSYELVSETVKAYPENYKAQASGREVNMFYLLNDQRERIALEDGVWSVINTDIRFNQQQLLAELDEHPERFSPNVILRPVFQEWILPNIAFIGGGGEIAYWLQLKKVFKTLKVPYPVLVLRNSFMLVNDGAQQLVDKLQFSLPDLFRPAEVLMAELVQRESVLQLDLQKEKEQFITLYQSMQETAGKIDATLQKHTAALQVQGLKKLTTLEKKMLRAEKKKFEAQQRQLAKLRQTLFPGDNLQERVNNGLEYYALNGKAFIEMIYEQSAALEQQFCILKAMPCS